MQSKVEMDFDQEHNQPGLWFVFHGDDMLVKIDGDAVSVPQALHPAEFNLKPFWEMNVGPFGNVPCYSALLDGDIETPEGMEFQGFRGLFGQLEDNIFGYAGRALQPVRETGRYAE